MEILAQSGCRVLDLGEALRLLQKGQLPARSVAITFDDGWADFPLHAFPVLQEHGFPATVYLTTYYSLFSRPLFRFALSHMMWKLQAKVIENRTFPWLPEQLDLRTEPTEPHSSGRSTTMPSGRTFPDSKRTIWPQPLPRL